MAKQRAGSVVRIVIWVIVLVVLAAAAPGIYHTANAKYQKFHYESVTSNEMKSCGGPITDSMQPYQKKDVTDCLDKDEDLQKAKAGYAAFLKSEKK